MRISKLILFTVLLVSKTALGVTFVAERVISDLGDVLLRNSPQTSGGMHTEIRILLYSIANTLFLRQT